MRYKWYYKTPAEFDDMVMYSDGIFLTGLYFVTYSHQPYEKDEIEEKFTDIFAETSRWLDLYFSGEEPDFIPSYRMDELTEFRKGVVKEMESIPYGKTVTYGEIAERIRDKTGRFNMSAQAVGGAVGWNPISIIVPCHRVMGAKGKLTGYGGGLKNKTGLLSLEKKVKKQQLRKQMKEKRKTLSPEYCKTADEKIFQKIISLLAYQKAEVVFCYVGTKQEINTLPVLQHGLESGKRICVPRCLSYGKMEAVEIQSLNQLVPGAYGIMEPESGCKKIEPKNIQFACIPCLSCSPDGKRLGYGGGFYDRYLPELKCHKSVLCRKEMLEEEIPVDFHDSIIRSVITD